MVLVVAAQLAGVGVKGHHRRRVEVVAGALVADPLGRIAGAPVREVELRVVRPGDPDGYSARAPRVTLPGVRSRLARSRDRERLPRGAAGSSVQGLDEPADAELAARDADDDLSLGDEGRQGHVVALLVVLHRLVPQDLAGLGVQRHDVRVERGEVHLVLVEPDASVGRMELEEILGQVPLVPPQELAALGVEGEDLVLRRAHEHDPVVHDRGRLMALGHARRERPHRDQRRRVRGRDLLERTVAPAVVRPPVHQPVLGLGIDEALVRHRRVAGRPHGRSRARSGRHRGGLRFRAHAGATTGEDGGRRRRDQNATRCQERSSSHDRSPPCPVGEALTPPAPQLSRSENPAGPGSQRRRRARRRRLSRAPSEVAEAPARRRRARRPSGRTRTRGTGTGIGASRPSRW